jgi:hypothetical protein
MSVSFSKSATPTNHCFIKWQPLKSCHFISFHCKFNVYITNHNLTSKNVRNRDLKGNWLLTQLITFQTIVSGTLYLARKRTLSISVRLQTAVRLVTKAAASSSGILTIHFRFPFQRRRHHHRQRQRRNDQTH